MNGRKGEAAVDGQSGKNDNKYEEQMKEKEEEEWGKGK